MQNEGFVRMGLNELHDMRGIGVSLTVGEDGFWSVAHVLQNGAASDSSNRLMPGEVISHVDEWEISGASPQQVRKLLEGPHGSKVVLSVGSLAGGERRQVEIVRGKKPRNKPSLTNARDDESAPSRGDAKERDKSSATSYDSESYAHSSGLHRYEDSPPAVGVRPASNGDISPYQPGKPREMVTSLDLDGTIEAAAARYVEHKGPGGGAAGSGGGGGAAAAPPPPEKFIQRSGGVFEEPLLRVQVMPM